jgi:hypothetical protein
MNKTLGILSLVAMLCVGCRGVPVVDRSIDRAGEVLKEARQDVKASIADAKAEFLVALRETEAAADRTRQGLSADVLKIQDDLNKKIADINLQVEARIAQAEKSAQSLITQGDAALQARIDQVFSEMRLFIKETLADIKNLISPILQFATQATASIANINQAINTVVLAIEKLLSQVTATITEVKEFAMKINGKQPDGTKTPIDYSGLLLGLVALAKSVLTDKKRADEKKVEGDRWKQSEIGDETHRKVLELLATGALDEPLRARMAIMKSA